MVSTLIPDLRARYDELDSEDPYPEEGRSFLGKTHDEYLLLVRTWLKNPNIRPEGFTDKQYLSFMDLLRDSLLTKKTGYIGEA